MFKILDKGQRKARKTYECEDCFRPICKNEHYHFKVILFKYETQRGFVEVQRSCCKEK